MGFLVVATMHVSAQQPGAVARPSQPAVVARATPPRIASPKILPGTRPTVFSAIQGNALTSTDGALADANIRLRDARVGQIIESQVTDRSGLFVFPSVDPGSYIVEIVGQDNYSVLAASGILNVGPGESVSAIVRLPLRVPPLASILGRTTSSAAAIAMQAASAGVLATQISGAPTCDSLKR